MIMNKSDTLYQSYLNILKEELVPAMGCTEPIALAYAAAKAREVLGALPERVEIGASGSIIKNVKSVIVPNTGHLKGMEAAAAAGIIAGDSEKELEVIASVNDEERSRLQRYLDEVEISVRHIDCGHVFDLSVATFAGAHSALVRICDYHTNIVRIEKDGEVLFEQDADCCAEPQDRADRSLLTIESIWDFAMSVDPADVSELLDRQSRFNSLIADEGLFGDYGANISEPFSERMESSFRVFGSSNLHSSSNSSLPNHSSTGPPRSWPWTVSFPSLISAHTFTQSASVSWQYSSMLLISGMSIII